MALKVLYGYLMKDHAERLLIGVDGGGSGCRAAVARKASSPLAVAKAGPANVATGFDLAISNVTRAVELALDEAAVSRAMLDGASVHIGLAGVVTDEVAARVRAALPFPSCTVTDDMPTSLAGALGAEDGFLLSVGTGTFAGAARAGQTTYVGGWGFYVSDQASGAWLGRNLLDVTLQCHDGVLAHSDLTRVVMAQFENDPARIVAFSVSADPGDYAKFAPQIVQAAERGDGNAEDLMRHGADYLIRALRRLGCGPGDRVCLSGGLGRFYRPYLPSEFMANLTQPRGSALDGALHLAAQKAEVRA